MEKYESIENVLENMDNNIVHKTRNSILPTILLLVAGVGFFMFYSLLIWPINSTYPPLFIMLGSISLILGAIKAFNRNIYFKATINHQKLKKFELYFDTNEEDKLVRLIENGNITDLKFLKRSVNSGLKLCLMATKDNKICFSQVSNYIPFEYVNINETKQHSQTEAELLKSLINR